MGQTDEWLEVEREGGGVYLCDLHFCGDGAVSLKKVKASINSSIMRKRNEEGRTGTS